MSTNDVADLGLLLRSIACVVGLLWALRVMGRRLVREWRRKELFRAQRSLDIPVDYRIRIASHGSLMRSGVAVSLGLIFCVTSAMLLSDQTDLYLQLAPWLGLFFVSAVGAWSVIEEQTDLAIERYEAEHRAPPGAPPAGKPDGGQG